MLFEQVIAPAIDGIIDSKILPSENMKHPILRCSIPCIGANESSESPDSIDCDVSLNRQVLIFVSSSISFL